MKIAVVGGGIAGLTAAYRLSLLGHQITIFEKEKQLGGLAVGFRSENWQWSLDNFFHHLFTSDLAAIDLINELGLEDKLFFRKPKTSIFINSQCLQFDSVLSVIRFSHLSLPDRFRTGLVTQYLRLINNWVPFEKVAAIEWLKKYYGRKVYQTLWEPLLKSKFGTQSEIISMAWFWARIKKRSPRLGYLEGGFQILIDKLITKTKANIFLNTEIKDYRKLEKDYNKIIITTPTDKLPPMIGAINLILVLKNQFLTDGTYWLNINESNFPFVAVVEHTNFVDKKYYGGNHILYVGGYYPQNHRYFRMSVDQIYQEFLPYLQKINPNLLPVTCYLSRNLFAQPVIPVNYSQIIKPLLHPSPKIYLANMQMVYPYDRGLNYAIDIAQKTAKIANDDAVNHFSSTRAMA